MSFDDDDIAETGDKHEIDGREYSVVGNTVYVKNFWGLWKPVEDEFEEAEAGDQKEVNYETYSVVGDKVYRKNWLGGWHEVEDEEERAEAGEIEEVDGVTFSRIGDTVYRKSFFGRWKPSEDDKEIAEAGDLREVNGIEYSVVGNTVYKKNWIGLWVEVEDEQECAEAGDQYDVDGVDYSRTGDTIYKKGFFGDWSKVSGPDDDEEEEHHSDGDSSYQSYRDSDDDDYSSSSSSDYSSGTSVSDPYGFLKGIAGLAFICVVVYFTFLRGCFSSNSSQSSVSKVATQYNGTPQQQLPPSNPYGEGNGMVTFYKTCVYCQNIEVLFEGNIVLTVNNAPLNDINCNGQGTFPVNVPAGTRVFVFRNENGNTWEKTVEVVESECILVEVTKPENTDQEASIQGLTETEQTTNSPAGVNSKISILSPKQQENFDYPRYTQVTWTAMNNADSYEIELQLSDAPYDYSSASYSAMPYSNKGIYATMDLSITVQGMGKQVHRVRVKAISNGQVISISEWRYFNYLQ